MFKILIHRALGQDRDPPRRVDLLASSTALIRATAAQGGTIPSQLGLYRLRNRFFLSPRHPDLELLYDNPACLSSRTIPGDTICSITGCESPGFDHGYDIAGTTDVAYGLLDHAV